MIQIEIRPLIGVVINEKVSVDFGMNRGDLISLLGFPSSQYENEYYYDNLELRFDLDPDDRIEFIESYNGPVPEHTVIDLYGINPFETECVELVYILDAHDLGEADTSEAPYCYHFLELSIGVYRESTEEDVLEKIEELKENGPFGESNESLLEELEKSKYFWTMGFGKEGYYK